MVKKVDVEGDELTMHQVRIGLAEVLRDIREKTITPANANAFANVIGKYLSTIKVELEYARLTGRRIPSIAALVSGPSGPESIETTQRTA